MILHLKESLMFQKEVLVKLLCRKYTSLAEKKKYLTFTSINSFHPYYPGSIKHYLLGGVHSPEIYFLEGVNFFIHHFKKLSSPSFKNPSQKRKAYDSWKSKVINFNKTEYKKTPLQ